MPTTFRDYYATLGVPRTATEKEIKTSFRKLARKYHPDVNQNNKDAEARFKEITEAYEVLGDPDKRKTYDELGSQPQGFGFGAGSRAAGAGTAGGPQVEYRTVSPEEMESLFGTTTNPFSDFFHDVFGRGAAAFRGGAAPAGGRTRAPAPTVPRRGGDVEGEAEISLEEAFRGTVRTLELTGSAGTRRVEVRIPAGIRDGAKVRASGQGSPGSDGGGAGDLLVRVRLRPHHTFTREGDNLRVNVPVPLGVALLGGSVEVPTLGGKRVALTVPAETQNGARLRLRGLGMPRLKGEATGDLIAEVDVRLPVPLTAEQRQAAASFQKA
ncbi:MAG: DnaJ C-terminal domain-containing protein [Candidatus Dormibacteria bacterium]|jgi:DnaJ-class molecular chaperone